MGMFDKPQFLTGANGLFSAGDTFWLFNAKLDGVATVRGSQREQVKLEVARDRNGERIVCFTAGIGIVNQIKRMDSNDRAALPIEVRLDEVPSDKGNPTRVLTPAAQEPPQGTLAVDSDDPNF